MTARQAHRAVAFTALDDIVNRKPRRDWNHPVLARQLGVDPHFVSLIQNYLLYRTDRSLSQEIEVRPCARDAAELVRIKDGERLVLFPLLAPGGGEARLAALLEVARTQKCRVAADVIAQIEQSFSRACGVLWEAINSIYQRQHAAQKKAVQR
ncbi:hypothetical protein [Streptomyces sp. NPDC088752]|uniref:hypothetical protein n=1 Tax=Streptomyces sp. NPDC088752 TaxID=3154963 RepID=UPI0034185D5C